MPAPDQRPMGGRRTRYPRQAFEWDEPWLGTQQDSRGDWIVVDDELLGRGSIWCESVVSRVRERGATRVGADGGVARAFHKGTGPRRRERLGSRA